MNQNFNIKNSLSPIAMGNNLRTSHFENAFQDSLADLRRARGQREASANKTNSFSTTFNSHDMNYEAALTQNSTKNFRKK